MSGNVWEWVWDSYGSYPTDPVVDPAGPSGFGQAADQLNLAQLLGSTAAEPLSPSSASTNQYRIRRGGSVEHVPRYARNSYRVRAYPTYKSYDLGLRLVRSTPPDEQSAD